MSAKVVSLVALLLNFAALFKSSPIPQDLRENFIRVVPVSRMNLPPAPLSEEIPVVESPKPYEFGFRMNDGLGTTQHRQETADGSGRVKGSYGYMDPLGVYRKVDYTADVNGYRAVVNTNEPGTANRATADVVYNAVAPPAAVLSVPLKVQLVETPTPVTVNEMQ